MESEIQESYRQDMEDEQDAQNALNLQWVVGLNYNIQNGVHNLSKEDREVLIYQQPNNQFQQFFYASAHTGVIYDYANKTQILLQGHPKQCNEITCTAYNPEMDIIVTADKGPDCMLVVWDAKEGTPRKTIFEFIFYPHPHGTESLDISPDGMYILTISKLPPEKQKVIPQTICLWEWTRQSGDGEMGGQNPCLLISCQMDQRFEDYHYYIKFNPDTPNEFVTTGDLRVGFWHWEEQASWFEFYSPGVTQGVGKSKFTQTVFIPNNTQAVSGTTLGMIVVWDISLIMDDFSQPEERRNIKTVNLMNKNKNMGKDGQKSKDEDCSITILLIQDKYLVVGSKTGSVRFYDDQYRIISWFENIKIESITSISFAQQKPPPQLMEQMNNQDDSNSGQKKVDHFWCPDFVVVDKRAEVRLLNYELFNIIDDKQKLGRTLLKSIVNQILFIAVRPESTELALCCNPRTIFVWDYYEKSEIIEPFKNFSKEECESGLSCIQFSPNGKFLIVGSKDSNIYICKYAWNQQEKREVAEWVKKEGNLRAFRLSEQQEKQFRLVDITFSSDSKFFACYDEGHSVTLFKYGIESQINEDKTEGWYKLARCLSHTLEITSLSFGEQLTEKGVVMHRLFSISKDMNCIEYDIYKSTRETQLLIKNSKNIKQIEQEYVPTASIWYPVNIHSEREEILLTANDEFHLKLWDVQDSNDFICKSTCLGPTYGGPITKLITINPENAQSEFEDKYLAYKTDKKIVGIIKLPIDGNPDKTMGLIAHPGNIASIACSGDGKHFFTCGGEDKTINIWSINKGAISDNFAQKYEDNDPFLNLLEGGKNGQTFQDMQFFFYYAQIRSQNENTTDSRNLTGQVPLNQIPSLMRAMGHYPTNLEIKNMADEIKYSKIQENKMVENLDQNDFVKLFLNHRPVYGIGEKQIKEAFFELTKEGNKFNEAEFQAALLDKMQQYNLQMQLTETKKKQDIINELMTPGKYIKKEDFISFLQEGGEKMSLDGDEGIHCCLNILLGKKNGRNAFEDMPDKLSLDYIMHDLFGFEHMKEE